jgi:3'(2'), 5'-bisphosphate nucleotidase
LPSPYQHERDVALKAVRRAGRLCQAVQEALHAPSATAAGGPESDGAVREKDDRSPVTVADFGSQAFICRALAEAFPEDPVVGEEDAALLRDDADARDQVVRGVQAELEGASEDDVLAWIDRGNAEVRPEGRYWTLDPIDGTKGFVRGDQYALALALVVEGEVQMGVLGLPNFAPVEHAEQVTGLLLAAERGQGTASYAAYEDDPAPAAVTASPVSDPSEARFCESVESAHSSHAAAQEVASALGITREPLRVDSQAKYAMVARGDAEIYLRLPRGGYVENIWDHAAGMILIEEAGGTVTDLDARALDFSQSAKLVENRGIVATNGRFHEQVVEAVQAAGV